MAILGRWTGGTTTLIPTDTWTAPANLFTSQTRNDSSTYAWTAATSTFTLPSTIVADGYLIRARVELVDTSNGRVTLNGKIIQASGTGNFVSTQTSGFARDTSEDTAFVQTVAVVDNPSGSSTFQYQWLRDTDAPTGGTVNSHFEIIPLYYSNIGMYTGTGIEASTAYQAQDISTTVVESNTAAISRTTNTVTLKGDNKRYMLIGGQWQDVGGSRTIRMVGFEKNGTLDTSAMGYMYHRNVTNQFNGGHAWDLHELATGDETLELHSGIATGELTYEPCAEDVTDIPASQYNALIVIELNDSAEVIRGQDTLTFGSATNSQNISSETPVEVNAIRTTTFNDAASFTRVDNATINVEANMDAFVAANIVAGRITSTNTLRYTNESYITVNNVADAATKHGFYDRGDQSTTGTRGGASQAGGMIALSTGDDLSVTANKLAGGEAGDDTTIGASIWAINLDTLEAAVAGFKAHWAAGSNQTIG
jgi:hypothetical protein